MLHAADAARDPTPHPAMKVLLVSHTYADPGYWDKLDELGRHVELAVVTPAWWRGDLHPPSPVPPQPAGASWRQYQMDVVWPGRHFHHFYHPAPLARVLSAYRPHLVHVEQEPESLSLLQLSLYKLRYRYRLVFFTWENINPRSLGWAVRRINLRLADAGIVGNQAALERCRRLGFRKRLTVIPQTGFAVAPTEGRPIDRRAAFVVGFAGRFVPEKGLHTLVEAVRRLPDAEALLIGTGPLAEQVSREPRVHLLAPLPRHEMAGFWRRIDVLVLPSLTTRGWAEQFGRVLVEAMAAGVPVVGSASGAIPEVIGDAGLVFPEGDAGALAAALARLRAEPGLRAALSARGLQRVHECYRHEVITARLVDLYRSVLGSD